MYGGSIVLISAQKLAELGDLNFFLAGVDLPDVALLLVSSGGVSRLLWLDLSKDLDYVRIDEGGEKSLLHCHIPKPDCFYIANFQSN